MTLRSLPPIGETVTVDTSRSQPDASIFGIDFSRVAQLLAADLTTGSASRPQARALEQLRRARDRLDTILQVVTDGVTVFDLGGRLVYANVAAAAALGFDSVSDLLSRPASELAERLKFLNEEGDAAPGELPGLAVFRDGTPIRDRTLRFTRANSNDERWAIVRAVPIWDERRRVLAVINVFRDITDQRRSEEAAARAAVERRELLAIVSHDLRNPLGVVTLQASMLARDLSQMGASDQLQKRVSIVQRAAQRIERLIRDLLDSASIEAGKLKLALAEHDASSIVDEAVDLVAPLAAARTIRVSKELEAKLPALCADRERLLQVFSNVVGNAIKFTPEGGSIAISARRVRGRAKTSSGGAPGGSNDFVEFSVADTGPGIPETELPLVFDRYWSGGANRRRGSGSGLGLYISKGIIDSHGGTIEIRSMAGKGTTVSWTVPAACSKRASAEER